MRICLDLTDDEVKALTYILNDLDDEGFWDAGWQSDAMISLKDKFEVSKNEAE